MGVGSKWSTCVILASLLTDIKDFCKDQNNGFPNSSQFINFAVRQELERRKGFSNK